MAFIRGNDGNNNLAGDQNNNTPEADVIHGFGGDDILSGKGLNDSLFGEAGNDKLFGGDGNDVLDGGQDVDVIVNGQVVHDKDLLDGGIGINDTANYAQVQHGMTIDLAKGTAFGLDPVNNTDTLIAIENITGTNFADKLVGNGANNGIQGADGSDTIDGGGGNDRLSGNGGNDTLNGGANADTLIGSIGNDKLTGGSGADLFQYFGFTTLNSAGDSGVGLGKRDVIGDFQQGIDKIDLHFVDAKTSVNNLGNQDFKFIGDATFSDEGQVRVFTENGNTIVQVSNDGDKLAEGEIQLTGTFDLAGADFIL